MKFYYFNSTHWDREWYQTFQEYRKYLTDTADLLLDIFEKEPDFQKFIFDGQTIVLKDIAELRPSLEKGLKQRVAEGKLKVGPWYVMPDEFLVSHEAMIRNFFIGRSIAREFGSDPWPVCYICDIFGHIAQMPQIVAGFGLQGAVVWRGFPGDCGPKVLWKGADGTVIPVIRLLPRNGYGNFNLEVRGWWDIEKDEATFKEKFTAWVEQTRPHFGDTFILSDALDHCQPTRQVGQILKWVKECYPEAEIVKHTDYTDFFPNEFSANAQLPKVEGEQIVAATGMDNFGYQISATLSSRYDVKLANDAGEQLLELALEPQAALRTVERKLKSLEMLHYAWRHLVQNHAHDTICGCSIDEVHQQALARFAEVMQLGKALNEEFYLLDREALTGTNPYHETLNYSDDGQKMRQLECAEDGIYRLRIFRALPWDAEETREFTLAFPTEIDFPKKQAEPFGYEHFNSFRLYAEDGQEIPYKITKIKRNQTKNFFRHDCRRYDLYTVCCRPALRGCGWTTLEIRPSEDVVRHRESMLTGRTTACNGILKLEVANDGTYSVTDLRSGRLYARQNEFHFDREIGDGWCHATPLGCCETAAGRCTAVRVVQNGPARVEFEIDRTYELPEELIFEGSSHEAYAGIRESERMTELKFRTFVAMDKGSDTLKVRTELDNTAKDFRLRMEVPTGISGDYFVSQSGTILARHAGRENGALTDNYLEPERIGRNFDGLAGKRDAKGGVAILTKAGLHEAGSLTGDEGTLFVTLMRAFRRTVQTNDQLDGQLPGLRVWEYALKFFDNKTDDTVLYQALQELRLPVTSHLLAAQRVRNAVKDQSFFTLSGKLNFSSFKPSEDGVPGSVIIRLMNLTKETQTATLQFAKAPLKAVSCRIDETEEKELAASATLTVSAAPGQWITLKLLF